MVRVEAEVTAELGPQKCANFSLAGAPGEQRQ
jgi:hypothetical protein